MEIITVIIFALLAMFIIFLGLNVVMLCCATMSLFLILLMPYLNNKFHA